MNNMLTKKLFNSTQINNNQRQNNQVIIHTQINNYRPLKEYIINLNGLGNNNNKNNKYNRHISPENIIIPHIKGNKNKYMRNKNEFINNSFSQYNNQNKNFMTTMIMKPLKPYKKKNVLFNPNKSKEKIQNIKLDLTNYTESINTNCITDRTFDKTKISFYRGEEDSSFFNINDNNSNKCKNVNDMKILIKRPINNIFYNKNFNTLNNCNNCGTFLNTNKKCRKIPLSKKHIINKDFILNKFNIKSKINQNNLNNNDKYHKRFTQILILLLEKYFKTYLLKTKYEFINNFKKYKINKNKRNKILYLYNTKSLTERNTENKNDNIFNTIYNMKYKPKKENILLHKLKNENIRNSPDRLNFSELFRNRSELNKKEEKIKKRKESKSREKSEKSNKNNKNIIFNNIQNNYINIIKKNKSIDNKLMNLNKIHQSYNKIKPMLIVKKLKTKDNRIYIDIKYLEQINIKKRNRFNKLKITKANNINIISNKNNLFKFDKIYYKIENQNDYIFKKEKKLSCIQEEE